MPVILILLGYATGAQIQHSTLAHVTTVVIEEIGIGLAVGLALTTAASSILSFANRKAWITDRWLEMPALGLAAACFAAAQAIGGSGFIACYVGGLLLTSLRAHIKHDLLGGAETAGRILGLVTWVMFGSADVLTVLASMTSLQDDRGTGRIEMCPARRNGGV